MVSSPANIAAKPNSTPKILALSILLPIQAPAVFPETHKKLFSLIAVIILAAIVMVTLEVLYPNPANIVITTVFVATLGMFLEGFLQKKEDELKN